MSEYWLNWLSLAAHYAWACRYVTTYGSSVLHTLRQLTLDVPNCLEKVEMCTCFWYLFSAMKYCTLLWLTLNEDKDIPIWHRPWPHLIIKTIFNTGIPTLVRRHLYIETAPMSFLVMTWAPSQYKDCLSRYGIPMLKIRRSWDHLIFNMRILYWYDSIFILKRPPGDARSQGTSSNNIDHVYLEESWPETTLGCGT